MHQKKIEEIYAVMTKLFWKCLSCRRCKAQHSLTKQWTHMTSVKARHGIPCLSRFPHQHLEWDKAINPFMRSGRAVTTTCVWGNTHTGVDVCIYTVAQCSPFKQKRMILEEKAITELTVASVFFHTLTRCVQVDVLLVDWGQSRHVFNGLSWVILSFL